MDPVEADQTGLRFQDGQNDFLVEGSKLQQDDDVALPERLDEGLEGLA
jgi:hypothetical protein